MINRRNIKKLIISDPLYSDILYNCKKMGCIIIAYNIMWKIK